MWSKIIEFSLKNKLLIIAAAIAVTLVGFRMFVNAPIDVYPDINDPRVTIMTEAHGWAPEEMEPLVTFPIESSLNGAPYVKRVRSSSGIGLSIVFVEFEWGTDILVARQMVSERLQLVAPKLPKGVEAPVMLPITSRLGEIIEYVLVDKKGTLDPMAMRDIADWSIRYQLQSQGGIANVIDMGGYVKQYQVLVSPEKLISYHLTLEEVSEALDKSNLNSAGGFLLTGAKELMIRGLGRINSLEDIENVVLETRAEGTPILVKDVATVQIGSLPKIRRGAGSRNGQEAVLGKITKQPGVNTLKLSDKILESFKALEKSLPEGVHIQPEYVQADLIRRSMDTVRDALRDGAIWVVIVVIVFLFNIRTSLITLTAIPLSLIIAVMALLWRGFTINIMTLAGLAISVGMVVDDGIIDVENIFRRLREYFQKPTKETPTQVVLRASNEIRSSIVFATLIIVLVFIPLFSLSGIEGRMFRPLGWAVVIAMAASLIVALTVVPALSDILLARWGRRGSGGARERGSEEAHSRFTFHFPRFSMGLSEKESPVVRIIKRGYRPLLNFMIKWRWLMIGLGLLLVIATVVAIPRLGTEFLPVMDEATFTINAVFPPGTSLVESTRVGGEIEKILLTIPSVTSVTNRTGRAEEDEHAEGVNYNEMLVNLTPPEERKKTREDLLAEIRALLSPEKFPGVVVTVGQPLQHRLDHLLSGVSAQVAIKLFGGDLSTLWGKAEEIRSVVAQVPGVADLQVEQQVQVPQLQLKVDRPAAARYGLGVVDITHFAEAAFNGEVVSQVLQGQRQYNLFVRLDEASINDIDKIRNMQLRAPTGNLVSLKQVADIRIGEGPTTINRENVSRRIVIQCNVQGRDLGSFIADVKKEIDENVKIPEGYFLTYGGQFESQQAAQRLILIQSGFVLIGVFILLYLAMHSIRLSLLVMLNLPFALIGGVISVFLSGGVMSIPSMVGFILLFGIAVRNGIILVTHINYLRDHEGLPLYEAIIQGAEERISPVLMTALAAALGMLPLAIAHGSGAELQKPLAIVIVGGMVTSTLLTLLVLPALYYLVERRGAERVSE
ncbi:efflux RND transporter permease subunit [Candidatus Poribacteria bacterium]|nr:efflux RND transporter permease subunit [Candidatus Poribacteria bacterium]